MDYVRTTPADAFDDYTHQVGNTTVIDFGQAYRDLESKLRNDPSVTFTVRKNTDEKLFIEVEIPNSTQPPERHYLLKFYKNSRGRVTVKTFGLYKGAADYKTNITQYTDILPSGAYYEYDYILNNINQELKLF